MAIYMMRELPDYLCFTANTAGSKVRLNKWEYATSTVIETSADWSNWATYTFGTDITLSNIGDKVYWRNTSETDTGFTTDIYSSNQYNFVLSWNINASWDINFLLNKNSTDTVSNYCFYNLFSSCSALRTPPSLPATTLWKNCYMNMFYSCNNLSALPKLPAISLPDNCYNSMFYYSNKWISATQTGDFQYEYRIPAEWTGSQGVMSTYQMFNIWTTTPSLNTIYYATVPSV